MGALARRAPTRTMALETLGESPQKNMYIVLGHPLNRERRELEGHHSEMDDCFEYMREPRQHPARRTIWSRMEIQWVYQIGRVLLITWKLFSLKAETSNTYLLRTTHTPPAPLSPDTPSKDQTISQFPILHAAARPVPHPFPLQIPRLLELPGFQRHQESIHFPFLPAQRAFLTPLSMSRHVWVLSSGIGGGEVKEVWL